MQIIIKNKANLNKIKILPDDKTKNAGETTYNKF